MPSTPDRALAEIKEMAAPVPEKRRAPGGSKSGDGTPEDPQGRGRQRPGGPGLRSPGRGVQRSRQGQAPAGRGRAGIAPAPRGPAPRSSRRQPGTHLPSRPRRRSLSVKHILHRAAQGRGARLATPRSLPLDRPMEEADATGRGVANRSGESRGGARRVGGGARRGRRSDDTAARRKYSRPRRSGAAAQRLDRGAG